MYVIEISLREQVKIQISFLPVTKKEDFLLPIASHQMLKMLYFLRVYLAMEIEP